MKNLQLILISIFALTLVACGGDDGKKQNPTPTPKVEDKTEPTKTTCTVKAKTITLSDIKYNTADYDKDGDGCLSAKEFNDLKEKAKADAAAAAAKLKAELEARTVKAKDTDISNADNNYIKINSLQITGSDNSVEESGSKLAVLDASKNDGKFIMEVGFARDAVAGESIFLGISPEADTSSAISGNVTKLNNVARLNITNNPSSKIAVFNCTYVSSTPKITCSDTDFALKGITSVPVNANLYLMMCKTANGATTCLNHANIKLKLK